MCLQPAIAPMGFGAGPFDGVLNRDGGQNRGIHDDGRPIHAAPHAPIGQLIHQQLAAGTLDLVVSFQKSSCVTGSWLESFKAEHQYRCVMGKGLGRP